MSDPNSLDEFSNFAYLEIRMLLHKSKTHVEGWKRGKFFQII